jgi:hypothetical protein
LEALTKFVRAITELIRELRLFAEAIGGDWFGFLAGVALLGYCVLKLWPGIQQWLLERQRSRQEHDRAVKALENRHRRLLDREERRRSSNPTNATKGKKSRDGEDRDL